MPSPVRQPRGPPRLPLTKASLCLGLYAAVVVLPLSVMIAGSSWLKSRFEAFWWVIPAVVMTLLASAAPLIYLTILRRLEGRILRDQRRYHRTLIAASSGMTRIKDIQTLCRLIVHVINRTVQLTHTGLFLYDNDAQRYVLRAVRHRAMMSAELTVEPTDPLIELLQEQKDILLLEELQAEMDTRGADERAKRSAWSYSWMRKLEALLVVPSFSGEKL